ncbi:MAG: hypothetical protein IJC16_03970 [Rikenellaceae bacterium]|nr:hypothetical protein [Rikenellaceae bacterium]
MKFSKLAVFGLMTLLGGGFSARAVAQPTAENLRDFDYIKGSDGWLTSYNAAGLLSLPVTSTSVVEASFGKNNGKFVNYYQSDDSYDFGLQTESFYKLSPKVALYGNVSYNNFRGRNMTGSSFVDPYYNLFDIVEADPGRLGKKQKETYHLVGGIGFRVFRGLSLGAKVDYTAANYAKMRDLRHVNSLLDLTLTAGASYCFNKVVDLGVSYFYRRSVESVKFQLSGEAGKLYESLISYGAFYGMYETFIGESGYASSAAQPMFNRFHGGSLQLNLRFSPRVSWFSELTYKGRTGYYGEKSSKTVTFAEHDATIYEYSGQLSVRKAGTLHTLKVGVAYEDGTNDQNIYKMTDGSSGGGNSVVEYFGSNEVVSRQTLNGKAVYTLNLGVRDYQPAWVLKAGADLWTRDMKVSVYPYYRKHSTTSAQGYVSALRNIISGRNMYSVRLAAGYGFGNGTRSNDGLYAAPSESQKPPKESAYYLNREFEYLTASRVNAGIGFRYSRFFKKGFTGYVAADYDFTKAFDVHYLGSSAGVFVLKVGCSF